jgi:hypothetical protein
MQNLVIYKEDDKLLIRINNKLYLLLESICLGKPYDIILSINLKNNLIFLYNNNVVTSIVMENDVKSITCNNIYINLFLENLSICNYDMNNYLELENSYDTSKIVNHYNTFGFLKIDNFFISANENMIKAYSYNVVNYAKETLNYIPRAMENLAYFVNLILNKKIHCILEKLFNSKYTYTGSDSKIYGSDTNWHCDRKTKNQHLKCCFYLDELNENTGGLRVLPGSQHSKDVYNRILSKKAVPLFLGPGGFDTNFLNANKIPYYPININFGDFLIFNLALYHSAFGNHINKKMICMNFCESYIDNNDPEKLEALDSDFNILGNLCKNLDLSKKIIGYGDFFYNYITINDDRYRKLFKDHVENDSSLDKYIRIALDQNADKTELIDFVKNTNSTNINKVNVDIVVNNSII